MSPEKQAPQQIIDSVPGMENNDAYVAPSREPVTIENPSPQTLRTAIGSPNAPQYGPNVIGGPLVEAQPAAELASANTTEQALGAVAAGAAVETSGALEQVAPTEQSQ